MHMEASKKCRVIVKTNLTMFVQTQKKRCNSISVYFAILLFILIFPHAVKAQLYNKELANKYNLSIPPPNEKLDLAPEWLQKADIFTWGSDMWKDYKFILKDTLVTRIVRRREQYKSLKVTEQYPVETIKSFDGSLVKGVALISHVPHSKKVFEEAHKQGFKVIPYLHFTDIHAYYADQDVFLFEHPEILMVDKDGKWVHIPMDGSERLFRFLTCANSPSYWKLSLAYVKKMMDWGADGIFIDNVGKRASCFATKLPPVRNPEFPPYVHEHLFPDTTENYAWDRMLQTIRTLVKSYGEEKIVVLNSGIGTSLQKNGDCCMWESFIYSWAWEGRHHTWEDVKKRARDNAWYLNAGRRITALSFLDSSRKEVKEDAFWAFSAARLVDFVWWATLNGTGAEVLYRAHMGKGMEPLKETRGIAYRIFENGIIVLNDSVEDRNVELILPAGFRAKHLVNLFNNQIIQVNNRTVKVAVAGKTARVYLMPEKLMQ